MNVRIMKYIHWHHNKPSANQNQRIQSRHSSSRFLFNSQYEWYTFLYSFPKSHILFSDTDSGNGGRADRALGSTRWLGHAGLPPARWTQVLRAFFENFILTIFVRYIHIFSLHLYLSVPRILVVMMILIMTVYREGRRLHDCCSESLGWRESELSVYLLGVWWRWEYRQNRNECYWYVSVSLSKTK